MPYEDHLQLLPAGLLQGPLQARAPMLRKGQPLQFPEGPLPDQNRLKGARLQGHPDLRHQVQVHQAREAAAQVKQGRRPEKAKVQKDLQTKNHHEADKLTSNN